MVMWFAWFIMEVFLLLFCVMIMIGVLLYTSSSEVIAPPAFLLSSDLPLKEGVTEPCKI